MNAEFIETAWHEGDVNLVFDDRGACCSHGLEPFYAAERIVRENDGSKRARCSVGEYSLSLKLYYQNSGIGSLNHPSSDLDTIREFRISWEVLDEDDDVGQRSGNIHIAPRTPKMTDHSGSLISTPRDLTGVNCRVLGSNFPVPKYGELLHRATEALGFDSRYFDPERVHQAYSNIQDAARYVRLIRGESGPIHAVDGVLARVSNLLANDREGYRKHVADDTEAPGYYHTATVGPKRASELVDQHHLPKEIKHYLPREADSLDPGDPVYHPKVEVSLQASRLDGMVQWEERDRVARELDETLLNVLRWEGYPVTDEEIEGDDRDGGPPPGGRGPYVEDEYFVAESERRQRRLLDDPTPELKNRQENLVMKHVVGGFEDSDADVLDMLVSDGGEVSPKDIADEQGWHIETVYRAIERLEDLVEHHYGELSLRSHHIAEKVTEAVQHAREHAEDAAETLAKSLERTVGLDVANDALVEWVDRFAVEVKDRRDAQLLLRFGRVEMTRNEFVVVLTNGLYEWARAGWDRERFLNAEVDVRLRDGNLQMRAGDVLH
jgi:predicted transcriptional regulator